MVNSAVSWLLVIMGLTSSVTSTTDNLNGSFTVGEGLTPSTISGTADSQKTITITKNITLSSTAQTVYVMLPVLSSSKGNQLSIKFIGTDGDQTKTCTLSDADTPNHKYSVAINLTAYVDLDLPSGTLWATFNVGATAPEGYGDYFAWGEILPYYADGYSTENPCTHWRNMTTGAGNSTTLGYAWETYSQGGSSEFAEWTTPPYTSNVLKPGRDAATYNCGSNWRMPTTAEFLELYEGTDREWVSTGVKGWKFKNKTDASKYIFLPAAGNRDNTELINTSSKGYYWSSSLYTSPDGYGYSLYFTSSKMEPQHYNRPRYCGFTVRPVYDDSSK